MKVHHACIAEQIGKTLRFLLDSWPRTIRTVVLTAAITGVVLLLR
jgi:hypothetical protein